MQVQFFSLNKVPSEHLIDSLPMRKHVGSFCGCSVQLKSTTSIDDGSADARVQTTILLQWTPVNTITSDLSNFILLNGLSREFPGKMDPELKLVTYLSRGLVRVATATFNVLPFYLNVPFSHKTH